MSAIPMVVPAVPRHRHIPKGESAMTGQQEQFAATYQFGKTIVHVVAPAPMSNEELDKKLREIHQIGWEIMRQSAKKSHFNHCKSKT